VRDVVGAEDVCVLGGETAVPAAERYIEAKGYDIGWLDVGRDLFAVAAESAARA